MSVRNAGNIAPKHFDHIKGALCNFYGRHATPKSQQVQDVANSTNPRRYIKVTEDVHTHPPFLASTLWFTFVMVDGDDDPEEFHAYVESDLWPDVLLFQIVSNGDPAFAQLNPPPPTPASSVASYTRLLAPGLTWF